MSNLILNQIKKCYSGNVEVIKSLDLKVESGEFIVIVGPSGCGKSTLLRMIAGLEEITDGDMLLDGVRVNDDTPSERGVGMVFQSYALYPHMNVYENMAFALELSGQTKQQIDEKVRATAKILQLENLLQRRPRDLSGGQRQRVAIGRAIVREPKLFLFDEPLSNLDASLRVQMRMEIASLHQRLGTTIVYVTHDQVEAMTLANRIVVMNYGNMEQVGTPLELYDHPANEFVAQFIGSPKMNLIEVTLFAVQDNQCQILLDSGKSLILPIKALEGDIGQRVNLGIRPEHIVWTQEDEADYLCTVKFVEHMGNETYLYVQFKNDEPWVVRAAERSLIKAGDSIGIKILADKSYLFSPSKKAYLRENG